MLSDNLRTLLGHFVLWLFVGAVVVWLIFAGAVKPVMQPEPSTYEAGGVDYNYNIRSYFGCMRLPK